MDVRTPRLLMLVDDHDKGIVLYRDAVRLEVGKGVSACGMLQ